MKRSSSWRTSLFALIFTTVAIKGLRAQDINTGLVTNLEFYGDTIDSSPNRFAFSATGGTRRFVADRFGVAGRALEFVTAAPNDASALRGTGPNLANQSLSVAFWIKKGSSTGVGVFGLRTAGAAGAPGNNLTVFLDYGGASVRFTFWFDDFDITTPLAEGVWYHLACTFDVSTMTRRIYLNGTFVAQKQAAYPFTGGNTLILDSTLATLDDFRLYNRALTASDVAALANFPTPVSAPTISAQPVSQTVNLGQTASFSVATVAVPMATYQWRKDGVDIPGATTSTLTIPNVQAQHIGDYSVAATNSVRTVASSAAQLSVAGSDSGIWKGLVAYYRFSGNAADTSLTRLDLSTTPALTNDRYGAASSAALFNTSSPTSSRNIPLGSGGFTVSMWMRWNRLPSIWGERLVMHGSWNAGEGLFSTAVWGDGRCAMNVVDASGNSGRVVESAAGTLTVNRWYHLVFTADGTTLTLSINGSRVASSPATLNAKTAPLVVGGDFGSYQFLSGALDDVRVYTRALSSPEILRLYESEAPPPPPTAPAIAIQPAAQVAAAGESVTFSVSVTGSTPFSYQWTKNGLPIAGATASTLRIDSTQVTDAGSYAASITNSVGTVVSSSVLLSVRPANPGRLSNLSIRTASGGGNSTLIVGFVLGGSGTNGTSSLLTRASGPALQQFGVTGTLADPVLSLYEGARLIASNDNWSGTDIAANALAVGAFAFPPGSRDAAISSTLPGARYTAQVLDAGGATGVALVELYDTSASFSYARPRLVNISARATAGTGDSAMIAGFVVKGDTPVTVLIRGIGPTLSQFGVSDVLANPRLTLFRDTTLITANDNWGDLGASTISATAAAVGAFALPTASQDSAILATLQPGSYTVQVAGANNTQGVALIEIYEVPQ